MAQYEFECKKCKHEFTAQQSFAEHDRHKTLKCPKCASTSVRQLLSAIYVKTSKKS